ncbi:MAG TPA: DUF1330 domain-containing protein [Candidatus Omnitrophota bacterium]|nr:DUF1330 domain-containing protein [Candidatus Omnitrophota bacterium]HPT07711.1 DUF1330 domain-containing protein [Candidatus Omnitrophota bacterium]
MSVYMVIEAQKVWDKEKYGEYVQKVPPIVEKFGGKYLARGGAVTLIAGDWNPARLIIIEFGCREKFQAWWNSPEYKAVAPLREEAALVNAILIDGVS